MSEIPAALVKELRERTGAGMMDCKRALQEAEGDIEAAHKLLREWGAAQAGKRAGRETTEGVVLAKVEDGVGAIVAVGSETDFVSKNEEFQAFAREVLETVAQGGPEAVSSLDDERTALIAKIGESINVRGAARFTSENGEELASYVHPPANKVGVLVKAEGSPEAARRFAMHVAFAAPRYDRREEVPEEEIQAEQEIYAKLPEVESKPENVRPKIIEGLLNKRFFAENVLAEQAWIHEPKKTVQEALDEEGLKVVAFERLALTG
jgi:elongation factor Ts